MLNGTSAVEALKGNDQNNFLNTPAHVQGGSDIDWRQ